MCQLGETKLNEEETIERHKKLHQSLDELIACFITETNGLPSKTGLMEFMEWSHKMTKIPTCVEKNHETKEDEG